MAKGKKTLQGFLELQQYSLAQREEEWDHLVKKIRSNPNQMNVRGSWQAEQLLILERTRLEILNREHFIWSLKMYMQPKPRKRLRK